jgi:hypothetical protein
MRAVLSPRSKRAKWGVSVKTLARLSRQVVFLMFSLGDKTSLSRSVAPIPMKVLVVFVCMVALAAHVAFAGTRCCNFYCGKADFFPTS